MANRTRRFASLGKGCESESESESEEARVEGGREREGQNAPIFG